jgi:hypothetical protein
VQQDFETAQPDAVTSAQLGVERSLQALGGLHKVEEGCRMRRRGIADAEPASAEGG